MAEPMIPRAESRENLIENLIDAALDLTDVVEVVDTLVDAVLNNAFAAERLRPGVKLGPTRGLLRVIGDLSTKADILVTLVKKLELLNEKNERESIAHASRKAS